MADRAHAMVDAAGSEPPLGDLEAAALAKDQIRLRHPNVREPDMHMAVRGVVFAIDRQCPHDLDAWRVGGHQDHRMALMLGLVVAAGLDHYDIDLAARVARARRPPFFAVEHVVVPVGDAGHGDVGGIRRRHVRLGHQIGGADFSLEQRLQPGLLLLGRAIALEYFHVAGVRRRAVEGFGAEMRLAHLLGEIGVFDDRQAGAALGIGQPEVPQTTAFRLGLETFEKVPLAVGIDPAFALRHFGEKLLACRGDLVADHVADGGMDRLQAVGHAEGHVAHWSNSSSRMALSAPAPRRAK